MIRAELLRVLDRMRRELPDVVDAIAPFGFETLSGWNVSRTHPKRIYLYLQLENSGSDALAGEIVNWLVTNRRALERALESAPLGMVSVDNRRHVVVCGPTDGLACFIYFVEPAGTTLLDCYGEYVAMLPVAICDEALNEIRQFGISPSSRRFVFQVARMFAGSHQAAISLDQDDSLRAAALRNGSHDPAQAVRVSSEPDVHDMEALNAIVLPIARALQRDLTKDSDSALTWVDIHAGTRRKFNVVAAQVQVAKERVVTAYRARGREDKARVN